MYVLIGTTEDVSQEYIGGPFESHYSDINIALFDDVVAAEQYIHDSRLKKIIKGSFASDIVFKKESLLRCCIDARVEEYIPEKLPINPVI